MKHGGTALLWTIASKRVTPKCFSTELGDASRTRAATTLERTYVACVGDDYPAKVVFDPFAARARREGWPRATDRPRLSEYRRRREHVQQVAAAVVRRRADANGLAGSPPVRHVL